MANLKSAIKKIRVDAKRKKHNELIRSAYKQAINAAKKADKKGAAGLLSDAYKKIDKAAKSNVIHKNKAARLKSRLATKLTS